MKHKNAYIFLAIVASVMIGAFIYVDSNINTYVLATDYGTSDPHTIIAAGFHMFKDPIFMLSIIFSSLLFCLVYIALFKWTFNSDESRDIEKREGNVALTLEFTADAKADVESKLMKLEQSKTAFNLEMTLDRKRLEQEREKREEYYFNAAKKQFDQMCVDFNKREQIYFQKKDEFNIDKDSIINEIDRVTQQNTKLKKSVDGLNKQLTGSRRKSLTLQEKLAALISEKEV